MKTLVCWFTPIEPTSLQEIVPPLAADPKTWSEFVDPKGLAFSGFYPHIALHATVREMITLNIQGSYEEMLELVPKHIYGCGRLILLAEKNQFVTLGKKKWERTLGIHDRFNEIVNKGSGASVSIYSNVAGTWRVTVNHYDDQLCRTLWHQYQEAIKPKYEKEDVDDIGWFSYVHGGD